MPPRKRKAAEAAAAVATPTGRSSRRTSGRVSSSGKKSSYFEELDGNVSASVDELADSRPRKAAKIETKSPRRKAKAKVESEDELQNDKDENENEDEDVGENSDEVDGSDDGYNEGDVYEEYEEYKDASVEESSDDGSGGDDSESEPPAVQKRGRGRPSAKKAAATPVKKPVKANTKARMAARPKPKAKAKAESEEPDAEEDSDDDEENRITFIPAVQLRDLDGVDYEDTKIHKNTFLFLKDLKANNQRNWLKMNDKEYRRSLKDWESFVETLTEKIIEADETIPELPLKDVIFRIYRDIRFSNDPTPYKPHYSAAWSRTGRKGPYACYYVHVEPGKCMVGGGLWHPDAPSLAKLRASVDERPHRIRRVLTNPAFRKTFLPGAKTGSEKAVVTAFAAANKENALKTKPKGFNPDHRDIELLKLRNYTIGKKIPDADLLADDAQERIMNIITPMVEFVTFLNSVVMPDPGADSDSDEADDAGDAENDEEPDDGSDSI
ncbi:hypothetical protein F4821DRAFT_245784 [Hypoxylon rubiginosum]|uniref:Uncharacterized protein n=1 Tax=Hypoxylon rubiginosum TaxID=110542 RepID=A0ACC0CRJ7_9PEZI|nr:hypothetical protein F4821DRAFT_245784 [Hypoxylon rubiginosum]